VVLIMGPLFPLGTVVATPAALGLLQEHGTEPGELLARHRSGDWGDLTPNDWALNNRDLGEGERLFSSYDVSTGACAPVVRAWIITEADRSATTILLPEEY
jgi:hypothetical protein